VTNVEKSKSSGVEFHNTGNVELFLNELGSSLVRRGKVQTQSTLSEEARKVRIEAITIPAIT